MNKQIRKEYYTTHYSKEDLEPIEGIKLSVWNAIIPIGVLIVSSLIGFYYSGWVTGPSVTIVSDKFIYVSEQGGDFIKHKMYISVNGGTFKELKKEKFKVIQGG